jgi:hypothetical protein
MAHKLVEQAVIAKLAADWSLCPVFTENGKAKPPSDGSNYVMVQFPVAQARRVTVNQRLYREEGAIRLVLHVRAGSGGEELRDWIEDLSALFCDQKFAGVTSLVPTPPYSSERPVGAYFWASTSVPYTFNFTRA